MEWKQYLRQKGIHLSLKNYCITALSYMALGLFSSLIIGLIIKTIGQQLQTAWFINLGDLCINLSGPAIGAAVAYGLKSPPLVLFSATVSGAAGIEMGGGPAGAFLAVIISVLFGKLVSKTTQIDLLVTPLVTVFSGYLVAIYMGVLIGRLISFFGQMINWSVGQHPLWMGMIIAALMGLALTSPLSSAAIAIMLGLEGVAAGAATVGCSSQMIGFAVSSYKENGWGGFIAQGLGTSMLQLPNIVKNPLILIPPTLAGMLLAPIATLYWQLENIKEGAGMGTSGLVGQIFTLTTMGFSWQLAAQVCTLHIIGPALISFFLSEYMRQKNWIKAGDMKIKH